MAQQKILNIVQRLKMQVFRANVDNVKYYKILNFDLDTNMLKDIYYRGVYTNAQ